LVGKAKKIPQVQSEQIHFFERLLGVHGAGKCAFHPFSHTPPHLSQANGKTAGFGWSCNNASVRELFDKTQSTTNAITIVDFDTAGKCISALLGDQISAFSCAQQLEQSFFWALLAKSPNLSLCWSLRLIFFFFFLRLRFRERLRLHQTLR
jgi:hypothetical protein